MTADERRDAEDLLRVLRNRVLAEADGAELHGMSSAWATTLPWRSRSAAARGPALSVTTETQRATGLAAAGQRATGLARPVRGPSATRWRALRSAIPRPRRGPA